MRHFCGVRALSLSSILHFKIRNELQVSFRKRAINYEAFLWRASPLSLSSILHFKMRNELQVSFRKRAINYEALLWRARALSLSFI